MARSVQLSEKAYALLRRLKEEGESFSDVVVRLGLRGHDPLAARRLRPDPDFDPLALRDAGIERDLERLR